MNWSIRRARPNAGKCATPTATRSPEASWPRGLRSRCSGPRANDDLASVREAIRSALETADAVILTGGSSVGERDVTPRAIDALGGPGVIVHGIRVKPGKPTVFAAIGGKPVIGLPGNPTSALMILEAVAMPIVRALAGADAPGPLETPAVAGAAFPGRLRWTWFVPAELVDEAGTLVRLSVDAAFRSHKLARSCTRLRRGRPERRRDRRRSDRFGEAIRGRRSNGSFADDLVPAPDGCRGGRSSVNPVRRSRRARATRRP